LKGFKLYAIINETEVLISEYTDNKKNTLTLNETLSEEENNKYSLSFQIPKNFNEFHNLPENFTIEQYFRIGRQLKLKLYIPEEKDIKLVITSISPEGSQENILYNIAAEDYASYVFSKNKVGLDIDTFEDEDFLDWIGDRETTAKNIIDFILIKSNLQNRLTLNGWKAKDSSASLEEEKPLDKKINLQISNSNTYNAIIEVCILTDSLLLIDYNYKTFDLIGRNDELFFNKNYLLSPDFNLQELSLNYNAQDFFPILFVLGGTDDLGLSVGMIPYLTGLAYKEIENVMDNDITLPYNNNFYNSLTVIDEDTKNILNHIPYLDSFLLNLDYFKNNGLLTEEQINNGILLPIYNVLRRINFKFQKSIFDKYTIEGRIKEIETRAYNLTNELILSEDNDYAEKNSNLRDVYFKEGGGLLEPQAKETNKNPSTTFKGVTNETLSSNGKLFYEVTEEEYQTGTFSGYDLWDPIDGAIVGDKKYIDTVPDPDKYYVSASFTATESFQLRFDINSNYYNLNFVSKINFNSVPAPNQNGWVPLALGGPAYYIIATNLINNKSNMTKTDADFFEFENSYPTLNLKEGTDEIVNSAGFAGISCPVEGRTYYNFGDSSYYLCSDGIIVLDSGVALNITEFEKFKYYKVD
jgi:hypothetical protein